MIIRKRIPVLALCAFIIISYMPVQGMGIYADALDDSTEWYEQVASISYVPADPDAFTFLEGIDNAPEEDGEDGYYYYDFWEGDVIEATLTDGSKKTITCFDEYDENDPDEWVGCYWQDSDDNVIDEEYSPYFDPDASENDLKPGNNDLTIYFGSHPDENGDAVPVYTTYTAVVEPSPVSSIEVILGGTEEEISERLTTYEGADYGFDFEPGDRLLVTTGSGVTAYTMTEVPISEHDNEVAFLDDNGEEMPWRYGDVTMSGCISNDEGTWSVGSDNKIYVRYAGCEYVLYATLIHNPVVSIKYVTDDSNKTYTEADLILREYFDDEYACYCYYLDFYKGDRLTVVTDDGSYTYTYNGQFFENDAVPGEQIEWQVDEPYFESETQLSYNDSPADFYVDCMGKESHFDVTIELSSDAEYALAREKANALNKLDEEYVRIDFSLYREAQLKEIETAYDTARDMIYGAGSSDEIQEALTDFRNKVSSIKTDAQLRAEEEVARAAEQAAQAAAAEAARIAALSAEIVDLPAVKISKPAAGKKKMTVKWKKVTKKNLKKIQGIEIQVATDAGFTNIVKSSTAGKKKVSKKIGGLQKKTTYWVRVRAYAPGNHYSVWKIKKIKTK